MAELMVNIHDYLSDEQIAEVCKEEIRRQIRLQFSDNSEEANTRLISNISYSEVFNEISESIGADAREMMKKAVIRILNDDNSLKLVLFRREGAVFHRNSPAVDMMDEIVAENRGLMEEKVREAIQNFNFVDVQFEILEVAEDVLRKRIFAKGEEE